MRKFFLALALLFVAVPAFAADKPLVIESGKIKQLPANTTLQVNASGTGAASINIPHGTAPSSPANGDCWTTTAGLFCRINGSTVSMGSGGGAITASGFTMSTARLLGRTTASTGAIEEIQVGAGLALSSGVLSAGPGTGSSQWAVIATTTISSPVANIDYTGLAGYTDFLLICRGVTQSASGVIGLRVSTDNGATFYSTTSDYAFINSNGVEAGNAFFAGFHSTTATAARSGVIMLPGAGVNGTVKISQPITVGSSTGDGGRVFVTSTSPINALRIVSSGGGNFTAGTCLIEGR